MLIGSNLVTCFIYGSEYNIQWLKSCSLLLSSKVRSQVYVPNGSQPRIWEIFTSTDTVQSVVQPAQSSTLSYFSQSATILTKGQEFSKSTSSLAQAHHYIGFVAQENDPHVLLQWVTNIKPSNMSFIWVPPIDIFPTRILLQIWFRVKYHSAQ